MITTKSREKGNSRRFKKIMIAAGIILLLVILFMLLINEYVKRFVKDRVISPEEASRLDPDCILILGAGVLDNSRPSDMLEDRLLQGISLYHEGASDRLLMSGDHGRKDYDEVNIMKKFAMERGVPSEHIFMDHAGFSTYESLYRARDIFLVKRAIIVTQKYHLSRALYVAERLGIEAYGVASDPRIYAGQNFRESREVLARMKDFFTVIFQPKPTYLGDTIPIGGNGDQTNDS
jgi:vancomycin permeability regulator SanA